MAAPNTTLRLSPELLERADRLVPQLGYLASGRPSGPSGLKRSDILRVALERGLAELERETGKTEDARSGSESLDPAHGRSEDAPERVQRREPAKKKATKRALRR